MRRWGLLFIQTIFGLALFSVWLFLVDLKELGSYLGKVNLGLVAISVGFGLAALFCRIARWKLILNPLVEIPYPRILIYGFVQALLNYFIPIRAGEFGVSFLIKRKYSIPYTKVLSATLLNRIFDLLGILLFVSTLSLLLIIIGTSTEITQLFILSLIASAIILVLIFLVAFRTKSLIVLLAKISGFLPAQKFITRLSEPVKNFLLGFRLLGKSSKTTLVFLTLASILFDGMYLYFIFAAFGFWFFYPLVVFAMAVFTLSFLIPSAPLYLGTTELAGSAIFVLVLGMGLNEASAVTIFWHLLNTVLVVTIGFISLWAYRWNQI
jgi:uncharacterized protein (TIRG00374 family)